MNDKSIIGFGYKPNFAKAVCLKTNSKPVSATWSTKSSPTPTNGNL